MTRLKPDGFVAPPLVAVALTLVRVTGAKPLWGGLPLSFAPAVLGPGGVLVGERALDVLSP
ncbi:hypothetical protein [Streptomyces sp. NPDC096012]|uniref:hypothetical protein n=1 Tax=Streptomyces sp. NPDC096012 TaxID=3155684 RepID=UPI00336A26BF